MFMSRELLYVYMFMCMCVGAGEMEQSGELSDDNLGFQVCPFTLFETGSFSFGGYL